MKAASTAFRYNALATAIEMGIRRFLHQGVKCLGRISCVHCLDLQFDKNKPRYCSAMRSAITGLCYTNYSVISSLSRKLSYTSLFTQRNEVYSGSEATVFHLVKLFALQQVLRHNCPIIVDSFRAEDLSTGKEKTVLEISKSINNQVILTTTLKHEELGKYDSIEGVNHINYISHIPSKILDGRYVADFLGLLSALSIKVQS